MKLPRNLAAIFIFFGSFSCGIAFSKTALPNNHAYSIESKKIKMLDSEYTKGDLPTSSSQAQFFKKEKFTLVDDNGVRFAGEPKINDEQSKEFRHLNKEKSPK